MDDWLVDYFQPKDTATPLPRGPIRRSSVDDIATKTHGPEIVYRPEFTLYHSPSSFYSQKVLMILHEKNLLVQERPVNIHQGEQFSDKFLRLNPRGEVPVLKDNELHRIISDSDNITQYLESKYSGHARIRKLIPDVPGWRDRNNELHAKIHALPVESLTFGMAMFDHLDLGIAPHHPYCDPYVREQLRGIALSRTDTLKAQALRVKDTNPNVYDALARKLAEVENESPRIQDLREYEKAIREVEEVLDECEVELKAKKDPASWLICPFITQADISLGILLFRLWQLGFDLRMWEKGNRKCIKKYFVRMKGVESFQRATQMENDVSMWTQFVIGGCGAVALFAGACYWGH